MSIYNGEHDEAIRLFTDGMKYKLWKNRNKGQWESLDLKKALGLLKEEIEELEEAIDGGNTVEILLEAADVGNYALIVSSIAIAAVHKNHKQGDGKSSSANSGT